MKPLATLLTLLSLSATLAATQELWRIGEFNNSYDEFACARNYRAYATTFPQDVTYRIGQSTPKQDWSFVHPGPADAWAGSRTHPFTIEFDLPQVPRAPLRLLIDLVDVQGIIGSSLSIRVNDAEGTFALQVGHEAAIHDPAAGKEQTVSALLAPSLFRAGANRLVLLSTGSWLVYDAISLVIEAGGPMKGMIRSLTLEPTIFFRRLPEGEGLGQVVIARVEVDGLPEEMSFTVRIADWERTVVAKPGLAFGTIEQDLLIPEVQAETPLTVQAQMGESCAQAETILKPERKWRLYIALSVHTDIGYTDLQPRVIERHNDNTDRAIALCERFPAFGWNLETAWQADIYREHRSRKQCEQLYALARDGRIGIQANYLNMLTGLCSHEELNRWLYYAHALKRRYGVPFESALTTDVPTQVWSVPSTLAAAGIRYYANGINTTRGYPFTKLMAGHPFWWEGPDGSRVLTYWAAGYAHGGEPLSSLAKLREWILASTRNREEFPYDALFAYGGFGDNQAIQEQVAETAQQWAERYEYPKVIVSTNADYLRYMDETYGDTIPVVRGDAGVYWEDGAASSAHETALNRRAHETASAAEALFALAHCVGGERPPQTRLDNLWKNILLYDEHTWGAWCSISDPDSPQTTGQWQIKAQFAYAADQQAQQLLEGAMEQLAGLVKTTEPAMILFNATSWDLEGEMVSFLGPPTQLPLDPHTRQPLLAVDMGEVETAGAMGSTHQIYFRAPRIPAWGYVVCPLGEHTPVAPQTVEGEAAQILENAHLRMTLDPRTGGIDSLVDKATGRECVDQTAPYTLNEYLYVSGGEGTNIVDLGANKPAELTVDEPQNVKFSKLVLPGLGVFVKVSMVARKTPELSSWIWLADDAPYVQIINYVTREAERKKEAAYFAFPFAATNPEVRLEIPNGVMQPEIDQLPGACCEWYAVQHFARLSSEEGEIAWVSADAPLVCIGDINRGLWPEKLEVKNGHLYSYIMNNYWFTNYKADQSGPMQFRYAFTPRTLGDAEAARFGWQACMEARYRLIPKAQNGPLPAAPIALCRVNPSSVAITAIKAPEVGSGLIVRLFSYAEKPLTARLQFGPLAVKSAELCNLVEESLEPLPLRDGIVEVRVRPQSPTTVRVRLSL
ncbi:MAG: polysaccharide lyase family protein [Candidatus Zipacnadales bacterium]